MSAAAPLSPCTALCVLDPANGYCRGCLRTIEEIAAWGALDDEAKRKILDGLDTRRKSHENRTTMT